MNDVAIGVDIGGTKSLALLVSRDGKILDIQGERKKFRTSATS